MSFEQAMAARAAVGTLALLLYWAALGVRKGSRPHRRAGRAFFVTLLVVRPPSARSCSRGPCP